VSALDHVNDSLVQHGIDHVSSLGFTHNTHNVVASALFYWVPFLSCQRHYSLLLCFVYLYPLYSSGALPTLGVSWRFQTKHEPLATVFHFGSKLISIGIFTVCFAFDSTYIAYSWTTPCRHRQPNAPSLEVSMPLLVSVSSHYSSCLDKILIYHTSMRKLFKP
jgi:hypothetical protein